MRENNRKTVKGKVDVMYRKKGEMEWRGPMTDKEKFEEEQRQQVDRLFIGRKAPGKKVIINNLKSKNMRGELKCKIDFH